MSIAHFGCSLCEASDCPKCTFWRPFIKYTWFYYLYSVQLLVLGKVRKASEAPLPWHRSDAPCPSSSGQPQHPQYVHILSLGSLSEPSRAQTPHCTSEVHVWYNLVPSDTLWLGLVLSQWSDQAGSVKISFSAARKDSENCNCSSVEGKKISILLVCCPWTRLICFNNFTFSY